MKKGTLTTLLRYKPLESRWNGQLQVVEHVRYSITNRSISSSTGILQLSAAPNVCLFVLTQV
jgi:hypothetical protein